MITQQLINFVVGVVLNFVSAIPPLPPAWSQALIDITNGSATLSGMLGNLGILIPWSTVGVCMALWAGLLAFVAIIFALRASMWAARG